MAHAQESLRQLISKIAIEQKYTNPEIIINETSSGGANYTSILFTVTVTEAIKAKLIIPKLSIDIINYGAFFLRLKMLRGSSTHNTSRVFVYISRSTILCSCNERPIGQDGKVEIKILDLQTMQPGSPIIDLAYFIFTGSDEEFRAKYYEKLIDHYYTQLSAAMKRLHLDPEEVFSREDFEYELKEKLPCGLILAIFALPIVTVEEENALAVDGEIEASSFSKAKTSALFTERLNGVINDFVKWGIVK